MNSKLTLRIVLVSAVIIAAVAWRFFNYIPNATPVAAIALFSGAYMGRRWLAYLIPMAIMLLSDLFIGFHATMPAVYISFALAVSLGYLISKRTTPVNVGLAALGSSVVFFILTNFAVWITGMVGYPMNFTGLVACYVAAIPFFKYELISTLAFSGVFFWGFAMLRKRVPALA